MSISFIFVNDPAVGRKFFSFRAREGMQVVCKYGASVTYVCAKSFYTKPINDIHFFARPNYLLKIHSGKN
jgi:hypothetical protein